MGFRQSGNGGERRRRVLMDDPLKGSVEDQRQMVDGAGGRLAPRYSAEARAERQSRVIDFLPRRYLHLNVLFLLGACVIASLLSLHVLQISWAGRVGDENLAALNLISPHALARWTSSVMFGLAAVTALVVFTIRRHRVDDYRARYRVWIWAALTLVVASADVSAGLHQLIGGIVLELAADHVSGRGEIWSVAAALLLYLPLSIVMLVEMRRCRAAVVALLLAALLYIVTVGVKLNIVAPPDPMLITLAHAVSLMFGHLLVLLSVALYARHVFLDSQGLLPECVTKPKKARATIKAAAKHESAEKKSTRGQHTKIDSAHDTPSKRRGSDLEETLPTPEPAQSADDLSAATATAASDGQQRLSKAERRRLRKQMRKQQQGG